MSLVRTYPRPPQWNAPFFHYIARFMADASHLRWCMQHLQHEPTQHAWLLHIRAAWLLQQSHYEQHGYFMNSEILQCCLASIHAYPPHRQAILFSPSSMAVESLRLTASQTPSQDPFMTLWDAATNDDERHAIWTTLHIHLRHHQQTLDPRLRGHLANHPGVVPSMSHLENVSTQYHSEPTQAPVVETANGV